MRDSPAQPAIRAATASDARAIAELHLTSWLATYRGICADAFLDSLTAEQFESYHRPRLQAPPEEAAKSPFLVACDSRDRASIIGFARCGPMRRTSPTGDALPAQVVERFSSELYAIYVHPDRLGRGFGRLMFDASARELQLLGHKNLCVWVLSENVGARRFYERMGGKPAGESRITLQGTSYPEIAYGWDDLPLATSQMQKHSKL